LHPYFGRRRRRGQLGTEPPTGGVRPDHRSRGQGGVRARHLAVRHEDA